MNSATALTILGLFFYMAGIVFLAWPWIDRLKHYKAAKAGAERWPSGKSERGGSAAEDSQYSPTRIVRDSRLARFGFSFTLIGFLLQLMGILLSN
jgi:hypothetical protein